LAIRSSFVASAAIAICSALCISLTALPAHAEGAPSRDAKTIPVVVYDRHTVQNKVKTTNYTNKSQVLGDCMVVRAGSTCAIMKQSSASRSVGVALGASRSFVSSSLSISSGTSESVGIQCTSPPLPKNARFRAWPRGDRFTYKIKKERVVSGAVATSSTSGTLTTFNPKKNTLTCG
jgi:hypothetical protein